MVYAVWVSRSDAALDRLQAILSEARDRGLAAREALAAEASATRGIPPEIARRFLMEQVRYDFGSKEREGLSVFYRMAGEEGLAPEGLRLRLAPGA
jgi:chorismate dehydratase